MSVDRKLPVARPATDFLIEELAEEVLVYDLRNERAHCLQLPAALLWRMCDGRTDVSAALSAFAASGRACSDAELQSMLVALAESDLISRPVAAPRRRAVDRSRRRALGKVAAVAGLVVASPLIYSIIAPSVAEAASSACGQTGKPCTGGPGRGTCCSGGFCPGASGVCQ